MYTFSELILNIRKVGKIDSRKMQGQSAFNNVVFLLKRFPRVSKNCISRGLPTFVIILHWVYIFGGGMQK